MEKNYQIENLDTVSKRLEDKVAIVNGAGTQGEGGVGNGAATAILFAQHGAKVVLVDEKINRARETERTIVDAGGNAMSIEADATNPDDCADVVERVYNKFGKLDIIHNNVGGGPKGNVVNAEEKDWMLSIDLNLMSAVFMSREGIPKMVDGGGGSIINTSSVSARRPGLGFGPYSVANSAVEGLTKSMAIDYASANIRVNCIMPGPIWTPKIADKKDERERQLRRESVPVPKEGQPWHVGWAATFFASDEAEWITGVTLPVDGGALLTRGGDRSDMF